MEESEGKDKNFCQCGCGEEIPFFVLSNGVPQRFKQYHHKRLKHGPYKPVIAPKPCACGCGNIIPSPKYPSHSRNYILGHNPQGKGILSHSWRGGSHIDSNGYRAIHKPEHPRNISGYVLEHRLVWEEHNNAYLLSFAHVHHINGDTLDNRIENLQVLSRAEHSHIHRGRKRKRKCL